MPENEPAQTPKPEDTLEYEPLLMSPEQLDIPPLEQMKHSWRWLVQHAVRPGVKKLHFTLMPRGAGDTGDPGDPKEPIEIPVKEEVDEHGHRTLLVASVAATALTALGIGVIMRGRIFPKKD